MNYPKRHNNHTLEQKSEAFFLQHLPKDWNVTSPKKDYGQDLNIEICENGEFRGLDLIVQLKSSTTSNAKDETERQKLKVSTYNYLQRNLRVVILVKYIEDEEEAYWMFLKDIKPPGNSDQESFTTYIPRENKLSEVNWDEVTRYVNTVSGKKLNAMIKKPKQKRN